MQTFRITRIAAAAVAAIICLAAAPQDVSAGVVKKAIRSTGLVANPAADTAHDLVVLVGPGVFVSARMSKQGGANDITDVRLIIDGEFVVAISFAALKNLGLTQNNSFGVSLFNPGATVEAVTIGFPVPLVFETDLTLQAFVSFGDTGIVQITGTVIHGED